MMLHPCLPAGLAALDEIVDTVVEGRTVPEGLDTASGEENNAVLETRNT